MYFMNLKKSVAEAHRLLVETYGKAALNESCREWFQKFKNGEFDIEDKKRSGKPKVYEDAELEALLDQDSCQTQEKLARTLGVTQQEISHPLIIPSDQIWPGLVKKTFLCILIQIFIIVLKIGSWANISMPTVNPIFHTLLTGLGRYGL